MEANRDQSFLEKRQRHAGVACWLVGGRVFGTRVFWKSVKATLVLIAGWLGWSV